MARVRHPSWLPLLKVVALHMTWLCSLNQYPSPACLFVVRNRLHESVLILLNQLLILLDRLLKLLDQLLFFGWAVNLRGSAVNLTGLAVNISGSAGNPTGVVLWKGGERGWSEGESLNSLWSSWPIIYIDRVYLGSTLVLSLYCCWFWCYLVQSCACHIKLFEMCFSGTGQTCVRGSGTKCGDGGDAKLALLSNPKGEY